MFFITNFALQGGDEVRDEQQVKKVSPHLLSLCAY
jgi:hypothetical protein